MKRVYLDWNASAPLRPEAREATIAAMDSLGNPSSVHHEGRLARAIVETARTQVAAACGADPHGIVFTSGAVEAAALAMSDRAPGFAAADIEHDCILAWSGCMLPTGRDGTVKVPDPANSTLQAANGETGVLQTLPAGLALSDSVQAFGKIAFDFRRTGAGMAILSAHKIGGPKGVGALVVGDGINVRAQIRGGGQELGRRSGTENVAGIAGFGAAAEVAARDLEAGVWETVSENRDRLEARIRELVPEAVFIGQDTARLPNTSCFAYPGWPNDRQVMALDLKGFSISAGSACSSGKVASTGSKALRAMGLENATVLSAIRVSIGPTTTEMDVMRFAEAWADGCRRFRNQPRAAA